MKTKELEIPLRAQIILVLSWLTIYIGNESNNYIHILCNKATRHLHIFLKSIIEYVGSICISL